MDRNLVIILCPLVRHLNNSSFLNKCQIFWCMSSQIICKCTPLFYSLTYMNILMIFKKGAGLKSDITGASFPATKCYPNHMDPCLHFPSTVELDSTLKRSDTLLHWMLEEGFQILQTHALLLPFHRLEGRKVRPNSTRQSYLKAIVVLDRNYDMLHE